MRILIHTHEFPPFLGGLATTSYKLCRGLGNKEGIDVYILAPAYGKTDHDIDKELAGRIIRIPLLRSKVTKIIPVLYYIISSLYLFLTLKNIKPDAVLFITEEAEATGGIISLFADFKAVPRVAGSGITTCFLSSRPLKRLLSYPMSRLYGKAEKIIAVSEYSRKLLEQVGVAKDKIVVINNGINDKLLSTAPDNSRIDKLREAYSINPSDNVLVTIARILPRKGQDNVIRALGLIGDKLGDFKYLIVGTGRYEAEFKELTRSLGLEDRIIFTGGVDHDEIIHYLDLCNVFVHANRFWNNKVEGLPNAVLEASARSKPVIVGNDSGSVESVIDGKTGILVDGTNIEQIADAIEKIFTDPGPAEHMGIRGKNMIEESFTEERMIDNYYGFLKNLHKPGIERN